MRSELITKLELNSWGNSLGIRIPKEVREMIGLTDHCPMKMTVRSDGKILLEKDDIDLEEFNNLSKGMSLKSLTKKITKKNQHHPDEHNDAPVGNELW